MPKLSTNFEEILSRASGNFEEQNKTLKIFIIIINAYYNCIAPVPIAARSKA